MATAPEPNGAPARPARRRRKAAARLTIRMYRHGLGDCLLLRFARPRGGSFHLLIDCGLVMAAGDAKRRMTAVAEDVAAACGGRLDVVVLTHEHWDHVSGFAEAQARAVFDRIAVGEVWYGWTEDPADALGSRLRAEREEKLRALTLAVAALAASPEPALQARGQRLAALASWSGVDPAEPLAAAAAVGKTRAAFDYLSRRPGVRSRYLDPLSPPLALPGVDDLRVWVLGPPRDERLLKRSDPSARASEVYDFGTDADAAGAAALGAAFGRMGAGRPAASGDDGSADPGAPFDALYRGCADPPSPALAALRAATWDRPGDEWRRIDHDWTAAAETLALDLDRHTNNTGVVLAFEFVAAGEVLLFAADAQVGNWLSWQTLAWTVDGVRVTGPQLLERTVFYKVGHHGSHNATLREAGLERMGATAAGLVAFIPVLEDEARKNRWMEMPFASLVERLRQKTGGRLLRSDRPLPDDAALATLPAPVRTAFRERVAETPLYFEYRHG